MTAKRLVIGGYSGLTAGIVSAAIMGLMGTLPMIGKGPEQDPVPFDFIIHTLISILFGTAFALLFGAQLKTYGRAFTRGLLYGAALWLLGPVTLLPVLHGEGFGASWNSDHLSSMFPSLVGHLMYGLVLTGFYLSFRRTYRTDS